MHGNTYEVDPELAGRQVDLVFDPLELADVAVQIDGRHIGLAIALQIKRHVHPRAQPPVTRAEPTGIDYLDLIEKRHQQQLQKRIDYRNLPGPPADGAATDDDNDMEMTG
jgi:putative transposase